MSDIKPELSARSKYWIPRHRYYELKHFCLQYPEWKKQIAVLKFKMEAGGDVGTVSGSKKLHSRPTENLGITLGELSGKVSMVERTCMEADRELWEFLLEAVTHGYSYVRLKTLCDIPCERDMFYDRYRKFFWLLDKNQ